MKAVFIFMLSFLAFNQQAISQENKQTGQDITIGKTYSLESKVLNETRHYSVHLPSNYYSDMYFAKSYPVLYVLDAEWNFLKASSVTESLSGGDVNAIPEMIVIAISNTDRNRDMTPTHSLANFFGQADQAFASTGGAEKFLDFLESELKPLIATQYRSQDFSIIAGHSLAGLFVLDAMARHPKSFNAYIALDPSLWWDQGYIQNTYKDALDKPDLLMQNKAIRNNLIITTADFTQYKTIKTSYDHLQQAAQFDSYFKSKKAKSAIDYHRIHFADETHASAFFIGLYQSLKQLYHGHEISMTQQYDSPQTISTGIDDLSKRLGTDIKPSESFIDALGCGFLQNSSIKDFKKAKILFELNTQYYPNSFHAWHSLGEAILAQNKLLEAKSAFEKAVALNPNWEYSINRINEITTQLQKLN